MPVGHSYHARDHYVVGREKIREFARAVQDHHPVHWSEDAGIEFGYGGLIAPPTFFSVPGFLAQTQMFESVMAGYDLSQIMQTDQVVRYHRPIRAGDHLHFEIRLDSFRQAFGGDLIGFESLVTDARGEPVLASQISIVGRTGVESSLADISDRVLMHGFRPGSATPAPQAREAVAVPAGLGTDSPDPVAAGRFARAYDSVAVGDELPPRIVRLNQGDLVNYAGVSGDPNPIHWSQEVAGLVELDAPVAHGMLTIGIGAGFVTSWLGDPGAVREYAVRLTSPVFVTREGAEVEFTGKVKSMDPVQRTATIAVTAKHHGRRIFGRATATVRLR
ncbi:fused (3R)-hydroxyacyl-ACP dehydratase subunits HadA/HadB [Nocardia sp. NPDC024068]|uniref:fused (3R)-hydroxyacyl-ACP dehydratase subunits HadA/HadB n=1 Tax=Nocardia sp. NPDC024068 TaxID=3157197 RepID=UPI0033FF1315